MDEFNSYISTQLSKVDLKKPDDYRLDLRKLSKDLEEINQKLDYIKDQNTSILTKLLKDKVIQSSKEDFEIIDLLKDLKKNLKTNTNIELAELTSQISKLNIGTSKEPLIKKRPPKTFNFTNLKE